MAPKVAWTIAEDAQLRRFMEQHGDHPQWKLIESEWMPMMARSRKQLSERWLNHLKPGLDLTQMSPSDKIVLHELVAQHGAGCWSGPAFAAAFPGRSCLDLRNCWHAEKRKAARVAARAAAEEAPSEIKDKRKRGSILNTETPQAAPPVAPPAPPPPEEQPEPQQQAPAEEEEKAPEEAEEAPMEDDALIGDDDEEEAEGAIETEDAPPGKRRKLAEEDAEDDAEDDGAEGKAETSREPEATEPAEGADDDDDEEDDPDAPRVAGKPTHKLDGKTFYQRMVKGDEELRLGQDVYLENNLDVPYVARLTEIFIYSFAPTEVYFNARWCAATRPSASATRSPPPALRLA